MTTPTSFLAAQRVDLSYGRTTVVQGVDLNVPNADANVAVIGESGSGKTTLARALLGLLKTKAGRITFQGEDIARLGGDRRRAFRRAVQPVFQDGNETLDPRMTAGASVAEAVAAVGRSSRTARERRVAQLLTDVGLETKLATRKPHELSGGQRQRIAIARALAVEPDLLILDEPTSALDVTVQARILDLLEHQRQVRGLGMVLITHNLAVVHRLCTDAYVVFAGRVVEHGTVGAVLTRPSHPYTAQLRAAVPVLGGTAPTAGSNGTSGLAHDGCPFRLRCPSATDICTQQAPELRQVEDRQVACHHSEQVLAKTTL